MGEGRLLGPVLTGSLGRSSLQCGDFSEQLDGKSARNWNRSLNPRSDPVITEMEGISNQLLRTGFGLGFLPHCLLRAAVHVAVTGATPWNWPHMFPLALLELSLTVPSCPLCLWDIPCSLEAQLPASFHHQHTTLTAWGTAWTNDFTSGQVQEEQASSRTRALWMLAHKTARL